MTSFRYYAGLFLADYILFTIPMGLFVAMIAIFSLESEHALGDFTALMASFGGALITFTYFFSAYFRVTNEAFKKAASIYFLLGIFVPAVVIGGFASLQSSKVTHTTWYTKFFFNMFFFIDPLFTFFAGL
jgi:hypothetical protein